MICQAVLLVNVKCLLIIKKFMTNHDIVQMDINKWSSNLCLYFNTNKCNVLHSGEKNTDCDYFMSIGLYVYCEQLV